ncbi:MAG TPA: DUF6531 domain-containing protein, partial [Burkholderiales bacterium]|nr:DUF6531 domain-containing protein [Burkholderiales bacterium]
MPKAAPSLYLWLLTTVQSVLPKRWQASRDGAWPRPVPRVAVWPLSLPRTLVLLFMLMGSGPLYAGYISPFLPDAVGDTSVPASYKGFIAPAALWLGLFNSPGAALDAVKVVQEGPCANGGYITLDLDHITQEPAPYDILWDGYYIVHDCFGRAYPAEYRGLVAQEAFLCRLGYVGPYGYSTPTYAVYYCQPLPGRPDGGESAGTPPGFCKPCLTNPINPATGNKYQIETDYASTGPFPLVFTRTYNSFPGNQAGLGVGWTHTYSRSVAQIATSRVLVQRPDGKSRRFKLIGNTWTPTSQGTEQLVSVTDGSGAIVGWQYIASNDDVETYDASGKLVSVTNRAGITQTLTYDPAGQLTGVQDSLGRSLSFSFDAQDRIATMTDPAGGLYAYAYDTSSNNLVSVTSPDSRVRTYLYENTAFPNALTGIVDENNSRFSTYGYDSQGRAISSQHAGGVELSTLTYSGDTTVVVDPLNTSRTFNWQVTLGLAQSTGVSQPCAHCGNLFAAASYDANGNVASTTDWNGNQTNYTYDLTRNLEIQRIEGLTSSGAPTSATRTITTQWHPTFRLPIQVAEPKRVTTYTYDTPGTLTAKSIQATADLNGSQGFGAAPSGTARTWTYTNIYSATTPGLLLQQTVDGPRTDVSDITTYVWDNSGDLVTVTNALGQVTTLSNYDAHGRPQQITDPNGLVTALTYDPRGRLTSRNVGGELTSYTYDGVGQLTQVTLPDGSFLAYTYDAAHRLIQIQDNLANRIVYTLDNLDNRVQEQVFDSSGALARTRARVYDNLNRLAQDIGGVNPATEITTYAYDNQGNLTSITDALNHTSVQAFDALNRLVRMTDPQGGQTQYSYDGLDQLTGVTDPRSVATGYTLDGLGNLTQVQSPDSGVTTSTQDAAGNLLSQTDARGVVASFSYDALNRLTRATYTPPAGSSVPAVTLSYSYDQGPYGLGRLTGFSDPSGSTAYRYDQHGRLVSETRTLSGLAYTTAYGYDTAGRLTHVTYPSGRSVDYGLDTLGRTQQIDTSFQGTSQSVVSSVSYQPFGAASALLYGNAQSYRRSYDLDGRIATYGLAGLTRTVLYDDASRIVGLNGASATLSQTYGYDALDRLTTWASSTSNESFGYDATGNRVSQILGANSSAYTYAATSNRLAAISGANARSYQYDAGGNTQSDGTRSFAYDARGRLIHSGSGAFSADYQVNAVGQRVVKIGSGAAASVFHYDRSGHLIGESDASGHPLKEYVWLADMPVAVLTATASTPTCPAAPVSDPGGSFVAFGESEGLEVDVGEPDRDDLQWKLGSNTQANGQFVSSSVDWDEHKSYRWTLSYGGNGSGSYSV